jgi:hypothetical protein
MTDQAAVLLAGVRRRHRMPSNASIASGWACLARCRGRHPCPPHRMATALEKALGHHRPERLYSPVDDCKGDTACPHGTDYDGDLHFEADDGNWYCKALPTVMVCASCSGPDDRTLRATWPCDTWTDIARELGAEVPE